MRRRGFLQMLGGALVAPLMPNATLGAATKAAYPASALHAAIYHAKARVNFSVFALSKQLGIDIAQAEAVMADMSARGILGPLQGTTQSGRWALSKVWERPMVDAAAAHKAAQRTAGTSKTDLSQQPDATPTPTASLTTDLGPFLSYLQEMAVNQGLTLKSRAILVAGP